MCYIVDHVGHGRSIYGSSMRCNVADSKRDVIKLGVISRNRRIINVVCICSKHLNVGNELTCESSAILGDPIAWHALASVFGKSIARDRKVKVKNY